MSTWPRPCRIGSHGYHAKAKCWGVTADGFLVIEHLNGALARYKVGGPYSVTFTDTEATNPPAGAGTTEE